MAEKTEEDLLLREIDDDLRHDQMNKLMQRYGPYLVVVALALVVGVAAYQGWQAWDRKTRIAGGERFQAAMALAQVDKQEEALTRMNAIAADGRAGYVALARFQSARILAEKGNAQDAAKAYRALADDTAIDAGFRNLAVVLGAAQELNLPGADLKALESRVKPLADGAGPWRSSPRELVALIALQSGDKAAAEKLFAELADDRMAVQGVRARAREMASVLRQ